MGFDLQWLLLGLPIAFALGWMASRFDLRQWKREQKDSPRAYFKGLNLLLNEQHDKAIDAFIEAVQQDPDTSDLHFALGSLFRRRGEYERAVRVHEHLLHRADLPRSERDRAQHALAQDFMKAGLLDRAESAFHALEGTSFDTESRLALLTLHERSRNWRAAAEDAHRLEQRGTGSFASRIAHFWCELALEADARHQTEEADTALRRAREAAPQAARPLVLAGQRAARSGEHTSALRLWGVLLVANPAAFNLVVRDYASSALACGEGPAALERLLDHQRRAPTTDLTAALALLDPAPAQQRARLVAQLLAHPTLSTVQALLTPPPLTSPLTAPATTPVTAPVTGTVSATPVPAAIHAIATPPATPAATLVSFSGVEIQALHNAIGRAAQPLHRYRCAACGFEAQHYYWQCPGCLSWDSYPPQRLEDL